MISSEQYAQMMLRLRNENKTPPEISPPEPKQAEVPALDSGSRGKDQSVARPTVRFKLCRTRLLDRDNAWGSIKSVLDGLVAAGLIPGDREDQIELKVIQEKVKHRADQETVIEIDDHAN